MTNTMPDRRTMLKWAAVGGAGLALQPFRLWAEEPPPPPPKPLQRYFLFAQPDGSECRNVKRKGLLFVDIDAGLAKGRWEIERGIEVPYLSNLRQGNGPGIRGVAVCAANNRCYISASQGGKESCRLICVDLVRGAVIYDKPVPGLGRLQVTPDGATVFLPVDWFAGESACAVDAENGVVKRLYPARYFHHLAMGPSGKFIYAAYRRHPEPEREPGLHVLDASTLEIVREITGREGLLVGSEPHIQVDAAERYVCSYCRMRSVALQMIEPATGKLFSLPNRTWRELWPEVGAFAELAKPGKDGKAWADGMPSYHGIAYRPDGKRAWLAVEGNRPDLVEFDFSVSPPKPLRVVQCGELRGGKGWVFTSRKGDVLVGSTGKVHDGETGKLLGEVVYADGSPIYESKPCEAHFRGGKVVFGSASCACGYPPEGE
jgi:hypothetical protein